MRTRLTALFCFCLAYGTATAESAVIAKPEDVAGCRYVGGVLGGSNSEMLEKARKYQATHVVATLKRTRRGLFGPYVMIGEGEAYRCDLGPLVDDDGDRNGLRRIASGSGFFINLQGHLLTNHHVIDSCIAMSSRRHGRLKIVGSDAANDLAVLKAEVKPTTFAVISASPRVRIGQDVMAAGFPLSHLLGRNLHFTRGAVSALSGTRDDSTRLRISAPVQPGNSGGPLLNRSGHVVGVVDSRLSDLLVIKQTRSVPQNVNFAVRADIALAFLEAHGVPFEKAPSTKTLAAEDIAAEARKFAIPVECWG